MRSPEPPPKILEVVVVASDDGSPLRADVQIGGTSALSDVNGIAAAVWRDEPVVVTATAPGFVDGTLTISELPEGGPARLQLRPVVLTGVVAAANGMALPGAEVVLGAERAATNEAGRFRISRAVVGDIEVSRPAWEPATVAWDGETTSLEVTMVPRDIKALRVGADTVSSPAGWAEILRMADESAINALVIDTKEESGTVFHNTEVQTAHDISAVRVFYDLEEVVADMDAHGLYKITRIVTFQDNPLARNRPEIAARNKETGEPWTNNKGLAWLDPTDTESWEYPLALAEEACRKGFDEIQFDYVRFPSDGPIDLVEFDELAVDNYYSEDAQQTRIDTIASFLAAAKEVLSPLGCAVAADIFAISLESSTDEGIGQRPGPLSYHADVLSPMIYTYTYGSGWKGFDNPNDHAVEIVSGALDSGMQRLQGASIYRPWLQAAFLEPHEILGVQSVAEQRDMGWMLWSANTVYDESFLPSDP